MQEKEYPLGKSSAIIILIVRALLQLVDFGDRSILSIALQSIQKDFNLTDSQAGMLPSLLQFGIAILTVPAAMFADRVARRKVVMVLDLIWSFFTLMTGLATQLWHLLIARFGVGAGEAGYAPAGQTWLGVIFPKRMRSLIIGIFTICNPLGMALGLSLGGMLISATHSWRVPFYIFFAPGLILAAIVYFLPDYKTARKQGEGLFSSGFFKDWGTIFKIKSVWFSIAGITFLYFAASAFMSWAPALVMRAYKMNEGQVGPLLGLIGLLNVVGPLGGFLADKWWIRNRRGRPLFIAIGCVFTLLFAIPAWLLVGIPFSQWIILYSATTIFIALIQPVHQTIMHDITPVGIRSTSVATQLLIMQLLGGVLGPLFVGFVSDRIGGGVQGLQTGLLWSTIISAVGMISFWILAKFYPADCENVSDAVLAEK